MSDKKMRKQNQNKKKKKKFLLKHLHCLRNKQKN